jgi:transcriptional regulator with XRE-family HTH domain
MGGVIISNLGSRLSKARIGKGLTQENVAKILGITYQALSNYERGARDPDTELLAKLAELYSVSADYLLGLDTKKAPETIAAHHDGDEWTEEELEDIEKFKEYVKMRRKQKGK